MKKTIYFIATFCLLVSLVGCNTSDEAPKGKGETAAAYTMAAILTQSAYETVAAKLTVVSGQVTPQPHRLKHLNQHKPRRHLNQHPRRRQHQGVANHKPLKQQAQPSHLLPAAYVTWPHL